MALAFVAIGLASTSAIPIVAGQKQQFEKVEICSRVQIAEASCTNRPATTIRVDLKLRQSISTVSCLASAFARPAARQVPLRKAFLRRLFPKTIADKTARSGNRRTRPLQIWRFAFSVPGLPDITSQFQTTGRSLAITAMSAFPVFPGQR